MKIFSRLLLLCLALSSGSVYAEPNKTDIILVNGWIRETPPGMQNAAAFLSLHNNSANTKYLVAIACNDVAARCELHEHLHTSDGSMRMQKVSAPLAIAGNSTLSMAPGGYHVMMFAIKAPLRAGTTAALTFIFDDKSTLTVQLPVKSIRSE